MLLCYGVQPCSDHSPTTWQRPPSSPITAHAVQTPGCCHRSPLSVTWHRSMCLWSALPSACGTFSSANSMEHIGTVRYAQHDTARQQCLTLLSCIAVCWNTHHEVSLSIVSVAFEAESSHVCHRPASTVRHCCLSFSLHRYTAINRYEQRSFIVYVLHSAQMRAQIVGLCMHLQIYFVLSDGQRGDAVQRSSPRTDTPTHVTIFFLYALAMLSTV